MTIVQRARLVLKQAAGRVVVAVDGQCRGERAVYLIGHMRCGSTALSHILCGHPDISGFGEAHIDYAAPQALGMLALSQWRRQGRKRGATRLFDKVLHSRYDSRVSSSFTTGCAIFVVREPVATIRSIGTLFRTLGSEEYATDESAADYYEARLTDLADMWHRFPEGRRIGFTYAALTSQPATMLAAVSHLLALDPPLENAYVARDTVLRHGTGDPLSAHLFTRIVDPGLRPAPAAPHLAIDAARLAKLQQQYERVAKLFAQEATDS